MNVWESASEKGPRFIWTLSLQIVRQQHHPIVYTPSATSPFLVLSISGAIHKSI